MKIPGKIAAQDFDQVILPNSGARRSEVLQGPAFGVDVSLVRLPGNNVLAAASDPLSLIPSLGLEESAWLSVHLIANDLATTGFSPQYAQFVLNLPPSLSQSDLAQYWNHVHHFCNKLGVAITGGHTGSVPGQNSTIAGGGTMFLIAPENEVKTSNRAQPGDVLIVTKGCAYSSASVLAMSFPQKVKNELGKEVYEEAGQLFYQTSSLPDALAAMDSAVYGMEVTAMHDVTEGGVLGAVYEMCVASGTGVIIYDEYIPRHPAATSVCLFFGLDERYCIGAGSMIIAAKKECAGSIIGRLAEKNIAAVVAGTFAAAAEGRKIRQNGEIQELIYQQKDPYWAAYFDALKLGWQ